MKFPMAWQEQINSLKEVMLCSGLTVLIFRTLIDEYIYVDVMSNKTVDI